MNYDEEINRLKQDIAALRSGGNGWNRFPPLAVLASYPKMVYLGTPLTSTAWDGNARSTTAKTLIDLSAEFGAPAGIKSVKVYIQYRDSASSTTDCWMILGPTNVGGAGIGFNTNWNPNDGYASFYGDIPCDSNGDIYYQIGASGAGTFDVNMQIWGYTL